MLLGDGSGHAIDGWEPIGIPRNRIKSEQESVDFRRLFWWLFAVEFDAIQRNAMQHRIL